MALSTTAEVIGLAKRLEEEAAAFYCRLAELYADDSNFASFAGENKKFASQIERAYYGVITDALEGCFSFNIDPSRYGLNTEIAGGADYAGALRQAVALEESIAGFYTDAAGQSESLMADIPRAFKMVARKRNERITRLKSLMPGKE